MFIPLKKMLMFFGSPNHRVKEDINLLSLKISKQWFKSAYPKVQADFKKAKSTGRDGRSRRYCKEEQRGERSHSCTGSCENLLCDIFVLRPPAFVGFFGKAGY